MRIKQIKVIDLIPYVKNSRTHDDAQVAQIASSIKEFGWTNPILIDGDNGIIAGHGRLMAARKLGMDEVPTIELTGMTEIQKKAYIIADNKLALNAGWDNELLGIELSELGDAGYDLELTGFSLDEIKLLNDDFNPSTIDEQGKLDELSPKYVICPDCGNEFNCNER